jgi:polyisoprenoid-binding protein YceI
MTRAPLALLAGLLSATSLMAAPQTYALDPVHSFPHFSINHLGMATIRGRFDRMAGKVVFDPTAKSGSLEIKVETASITTGDAKHEAGSWAAKNYGPRSRDEHLRTADFFNVAEFPELVYKSTRFNFNGEQLESIDGNLTMVGVTRPVKFTVTSFKCGPHPFTKKPMCGADAEATIKRTDFGIKFGVPAIADEVRLQVGIEAYPE